MKKIIVSLLAIVFAAGSALALEPVKFGKPDMERGAKLMQALQERKTVREYSSEEISMRDLGDLLWAANGINRPAESKTTNPTAMNRQEIRVYVVLPAGTYLYDNKGHGLEPILEGDHRQKMRGNTPAANLVIVADDGEFRFADVDAGYVSQNIYLFCAANGMGTVAAAMADRDAYKAALKLDDKQRIILQHPVGYLK